MDAVPSVIRPTGGSRSAHLRALSHDQTLRRPVSPPGPPSLGRAASTKAFGGPTLDEVAILASRAVVALKEEGGSTKGAIKAYIERTHAGDVPDNALMGALRRPAFVEHAPGQFGMAIAASSAPQRPPVEMSPLARSPSAARATHSRSAGRPVSNPGAPNGDWWRSPVKAPLASPDAS